MSALSNRRIQAINEGQEELADQLSKKIDSIAAVRQAATDGARYQTFTNTAGPIADVFKGLVQKYPAARFIVPFINTPANIITFAIERTPAAPLLGKYRDAIRAGGAEADSHTVRIENVGVATVGFSTAFKFPSGGTPNLPTASGSISLISFSVHKTGAAGTTLLAGASVNFS